MFLTPMQTLITIFAIAIGTMITRFTPFFLFPEHKEQPKVIIYLGKVLPPAMMGLLVIYCLKNVSIFSGTHGIPEILAMAFIAFLHKWRNNVLLSIGGGTALYMILVQFIFV